MATASRKKLLSVRPASDVKVADIIKYHHITADYGQQLKTPSGAVPLRKVAKFLGSLRRHADTSPTLP